MSDPFKHKVHVLFRKEDLDHERLEGKVAIVLDVLFASPLPPSSPRSPTGPPK